MTDYLYKMVGAIEQAGESRGDPAAQAFLLGLLVENERDAFDQYQKTKHYAACKKLLSADIADSFAAEVIGKQTRAVLYFVGWYRLAHEVDCTKEQYQTWLKSRRAELDTAPGFVDKEGQALPMVYKRLDKSKDELAKQIERKRRERAAEQPQAPQVPN